MDPAVWEQAVALFHEAATLPRTEWEAWVTQAVADKAVAAEVLAMLEADAAGHSPLDEGVSPFVERIFEGSGYISADEQIGPYKLVSVLGEGGMGVVWLAEREDAGTRVAIKFLLHAGLSPERRERFAQEIKTLGKLRHPYIARFYDAGTLSDGTPWFVMEHVEGLKLTDFCSERKLSGEERLKLFVKVCEAVQYAHSQEIIHRDLKPSNILVESDGTPRLLDFGIARELEEANEPSDQTRGGIRFLSPRYAAPEWIHQGIVGFVTDVYSLGIILFELLTDELPAQSKDVLLPEKTARSSTKQQSPSVTAASAAIFNKGAWADLDVLCLKALNPDSIRRYQSVEMVLRDLNHFFRHEPLEARPNLWRYRAGKFLERNRKPVFAASLVLIVSIGLITFFSLRLRHERDHALIEQARSQRILKIMLDMLGAADPAAGPANDLKVVTLLDRAALRADALHSDPQVQLELYETLGSMYDALGKYERSTHALSAALERARSLHDADHTASILVERGVTFADQGNLKAAKIDLDDANAILSRQPELVATALKAKVATAKFYILSGSYAEAVATLEPLTHLDPDRDGSNPYDVRDSFSFLANAELQLQHFDRAEAVNRTAIFLDRKLLGDSHLQTGIDLMSLGSIRATLRDFPEAERLDREGIAILTAWYSPDSADLATSYSFLAAALLGEGKYDEAEAMLRDTLRIDLSAYGEMHERVAFALKELGDIAMHHGNLKEAEADYARSANIYRRQLGESSIRVAQIEANIGAIYLKEGRPADAEEILRKSVVVLSALPQGNTLIAVARGRWGRSLLQLGEDHEAKEQLAIAASLLKQQANPPQNEVQNVRMDLARLQKSTVSKQAADPGSRQEKHLVKALCH